MQPPSLRILNNPIAEGERIMRICNSCRYCEGYCAVFPAMEKRLSFSEADLNYLANLCHNCAECYYACQYAPPHEFAVNVPQTLAQIRAQTYKKYSWPRALGGNPLWMLLPATALALAMAGGRTAQNANFYAVVPHHILVILFGILSAWILTAHVVGFLRFWGESGETLTNFFRIRTLAGAFKDAVTLRNLSSNGAGCTYPDEHHSNARRMYHHFTFYGFLMCLASTTVAAFDHSFLGIMAPHPYYSAPVILGALGGIGLLIGPAGLYGLKLRRDPAIGDENQDAGDFGFLGLLWLTSFTGLLLLILREASFMGSLLAMHLLFVIALFLTFAYGKFVHGIYRTAALVRWKLEESRSQDQSSSQSH